jgi:hypothetical protein
LPATCAAKAMSNRNSHRLPVNVTVLYVTVR